MTISWERRHEALKAIHDKIAEVLAKLDNPSDPQIVDIVASITLAVAVNNFPSDYPLPSSQVTNLKAITSLPETGMVTHFSKAVTGDIVTTTNTLKVLGWYFYTDADIKAEINWKTSGNIIAAINGQGISAMNLVGLKKPQGASGEDIEITITGTGNAKGWICTEEI